MRGMILLTALALGFPAFAANSKNAFRGQIYSFNQLMRLSPAKRAEYISDLRKIVLLMEKQQKGFEVADASRVEEMKAQVAVLMQMMAFMPDASARDDRDMREQAAPVAPAPETPAEETSAKPNPAVTANAPKAPVEVPPAAGSSCQPPEKLACKTMSEEERVKLKAQFRTEKPNECITAGNFVKYRNNTPKPGNCSYVHAFPDDKADRKIHCDRGESLCNPLLFCVGVEVQLAATKQFMPAPICVPIGQDMTQACLAKYQEAVEGGKNKLDYSDLKKKWVTIYDQARKATPRQCDFSKDLENFPGLKEKFDELKASVEERYKNLCIGNSPYQGMFCNECEIIGKQIYVANTKGGLGGCAGKDTLAASEAVPQPAVTGTPPPAVEKPATAY